jgi:excisionase family DNA binding protein
MQETQKPAVSIDEAVTITGYTKNYLYKLVHQKKIPVYRPLGGRLFFKRNELENFLFRNRQGADYEA